MPFYVAHAREAHGAVLVAGCGAGRVLLPVAKAGADADAFDADGAAVAAARQALIDRGLVAEVWIADLRSFTCRRRYAGLLVSGHAFNRLRDVDEFAAALAACRAALAPGAWIVADMAGPAAPAPFAPSYHLADDLAGATTNARRWTTHELTTHLAAAGFAGLELWGDFREASLTSASRDIVWRAWLSDAPRGATNHP